MVSGTRVLRLISFPKPTKRCSRNENNKVLRILSLFTG